MASTRRFGGKHSQTRSLLLDAAEQVMLEEGYDAVTSRKLAQKTGLTHQTVFYYFRSMDDLFVAILERQTEAFIGNFETMLEAERPIRALWHLASDHKSAKLELEFKALAGHREPIRKAMIGQIEKFRGVAIAGLSRDQEKRGIDPIFAPQALAVLVGCIGRYLVLEESLDISMGHAQSIDLVEYLLDVLEEDATDRKQPRRAG